MVTCQSQGVNMDVIDLRSDFLARPSEGMRTAAYEARDSHFFGLREDPWQRRLEARIADLVGMEDALIFPTCTMANTTALMLSTTPGSCVLTQPEAHVLVSEAGAGAALAGLVLSAVDGVSDGGTVAMPSLACWQRALSVAADAQRPPVRLCVIENTHNRAGGEALEAKYCAAVNAMARARGASMHLDGSRLFNAAQSLGVPLSDLARGFDTVSLSLNKTFGSPIPALLAGSSEAIERALVIRQRLGGGMRPTGPASAAALAGLEDQAHLAQVQALTARLQDGMTAGKGLVVQSVKRATNIVIAFVTPPDTANAMVERLRARGLMALALDARRVRFVVYRGINETQIERAILIAKDSSCA